MAAVVLWRAIDDAPHYEVSSDGRVRSQARYIERVTRWGGQSGFMLMGRELAPWLCGAGYRMVALGSKRSRRFYVHRLVAKAFLGECPEAHEVNHKDGNKLNNQAENLEWVTKSEQQKHRTHVLNKRKGQWAGRGLRWDR